MEFTYFGVVALPLGILLLFLAPSWLMDLCVFFIPFSATSVVNITKSADAASGLPPWMFFGALYMLSEAIRVTTHRSESTSASVIRALPAPQMLFFLMAILASLIMPLWIDGSVLIQSPYLGDVSKTPLYFGLKHVTATLYIIYGLLFTAMVATKCASVVTFRHYLRLYCWSALFVCAWGGVQLVLYLLNVPYPSYIFNSSVSPGADLYVELTVSGLKRISSVSVEPSILAQYLFTVLPFILFRAIARIPLLSPLWDRAIAAILLVTLILSTSAAAYVGLSVLIPLLLFCMYRAGLMRGWHLTIVLLALLLVGILGVSSPAAKDLLATDVLGKLGTGSGQERAGSVAIAASYFWEDPLLGVGWGSITSHDLIIKLLANSGVLGLLSFFILITSCANRLRLHICRQSLCNCLLGATVDAIACLVALALLITLSVITEFPYVFGHFWFLLALSIGIPLQVLKRASLVTKQRMSTLAPTELEMHVL